ncbi:hypothetical protein SCHPADRAFT_909836 [Schizopora paradoxa]|uniref:Uncharacterized protein n=1 Tax=Schizopora paradoxa TaxID=27342 RepID=A0A0H2R5C9_9AGAM|nr:hypothetical protein SCHPADRAFT_909836 [Schizopora paradoxa]
MSAATTSSTRSTASAISAFFNPFSNKSPFDAQSSVPSFESDIAEELEDDNLAWGPSPRKSSRRS